MTTSFKQARKLAREHVGKDWQPHEGTLYAAKDGYEDALAWLVPVGARELLVDGDEAFLPLDDRVIIVDKLTGKVSEIHAIFDAPRLAGFRPSK